MGGAAAPVLQRLRAGAQPAERARPQASPPTAGLRAPRVGTLPVSAFSKGTQRALTKQAAPERPPGGGTLQATAFQLPPRTAVQRLHDSATPSQPAPTFDDGALRYELVEEAAELSPVELARSGSVPTLFLGNVYTNGAVNIMGVQKMQRLVEDMFHSLVHARDVPTVELLLRTLPRPHLPAYMHAQRAHAFLVGSLTFALALGHTPA